MAKTYLATQDALTATNTQVSTLQTVVQDPVGGVEARVTKNESDITSLESTVGADDTAGLRKRIKDNETAIGDNSGGIIKQVNDLESTVGTDNTQGLQKRAVDLEAKTVDLAYDGTAKRFSQASSPAAVASDDKHLLTKSDVPFTKDEVVYDNAANRISVVDNVTSTAGSSKHVLTKKDGDALYMPIGMVKYVGSITGSTGAITSALGSGASCTRNGAGSYTVSGLPSIDVNKSMLYIESISDGDNLVVSKNKSTTGFTVECRDSPNFSGQDQDLRIMWIQVVP